MSKFKFCQKRIESNINGIFFWIRHDPNPPTDESSDNGLLRKVKKSAGRTKKFPSFFEIYGNLLTLVPAKVLVLLSTGTLLGVSVWGNVLLRQGPML